MRAYSFVIFAVCIIVGVLMLAPKGSPVWSVTESVGLARCPTIRDANGNGIPAIHWADRTGMGDDCWPDHPDYVQPDGGWPPDPNFSQYPTEIQIP